MEKKLTNKKSSTSGIKEEDKVQQEAFLVQDEFKSGQTIMFSSCKLKFRPRWLKTKTSSLWVVKEIRTHGTIELESPYSSITKVVTRKLLQQRDHTLIETGVKLYDVKQPLSGRQTRIHFYFFITNV